MRRAGQYAPDDGRQLAEERRLLCSLNGYDASNYDLPGRIPGRGALWVRFGDGDARLVLVVAHLSLGPKARKRQFGFLAELIGREKHAVLMGDLNCTVHSEECRSLFHKTSLTAPREAPPSTYPSWRPRRAIDHILTTPSVRIEELWTLPHPVSDHLPLAARVSVPTNPASAAW